MSAAIRTRAGFVLALMITLVLVPAALDAGTGAPGAPAGVPGDVLLLMFNVAVLVGVAFALFAKNAGRPR